MIEITRRAFAKLLPFVPARRSFSPVDAEAELLAANERLSSGTLRVWRWTGRYWQPVLFESEKLDVRYNDEGIMTHTAEAIERFKAKELL
jgi:hypothetical protein